MNNRPGTRALRWLFARAGATCRVDLALDHGALAYELRLIRHESSHGVTLETFRDVSRAFTRQCELEALLVQDGWTLESCASVIVGSKGEQA